MKRRRTGSIAALICFLLLPAACSERGEVSDLYILEELETASSVADPEKRIERLRIFIGNHGDHPYRIRAYTEIFETISEDLEGEGPALDFLEEAIERESDPQARGMLQYRRFTHLWERDRERAIRLAGELAEGPESYYRLFLYISYHLAGGEEGGRYAGIARRTLSKAMDAATNDAERARAAALLGGLEWKLGNEERALEILEPIAGTTAADESLGEIYWKRGEREKALEAYIRLAAAAPGVREERSIDSLYALVHPGGGGLDGLIWEKRIICCEELVPHRFVDIEGRAYDLARMKGRRLVLMVWQPT
ncbi:MAG TPA: hypothetical protein ENO08_02160 [Candidatus Eisenbacteria bacterium]|uniref:Tetratricopeptide repeat protein n=1 Tax=Eiseniibacteriota bacterium TaxID=2212470 RepID=A0A7V2F2X7_UNCEI|nr:hypothetical protein [Candidatus Eisenbacteria bacterium]